MGPLYEYVCEGEDWEEHTYQPCEPGADLACLGSPSSTVPIEPMTCDPSVLPSSNVPLEPGNGGRSIGISALQVGDIILSTTEAKPSKIIQFGTNSPVSHTILYVGDGLVIESVENGVRLVPIETALADASFAVALRYPGLTYDQALQIRDFAGRQIDVPYDYEYAAVRQALFRDLKVFEALCPNGVDESTRNWLAQINLGTGTNDEWFCSELVLAAYAAAGIPLTTNPPSWTAPGDIISLTSNGNLEYVVT